MRIGKKKKSLGTSHKDVVKNREPVSEEAPEKPIFVAPKAGAAKKKLDEKSGLFKLREGQNSILVLPTTKQMGLDNDGLPWAEDSAHYIGGRDVLSLFGLETRPEDLPMSHRCMGPKCLWCTHRVKWLKSRKSQDKKLAKAIWPSLSCYANIVDLSGGDTDRSRPFRFSRKIRDAFLVAIEDDIDFYNPMNLLVVRIRMKRTGPNPMNVEYTCTIKDDKSRRKGKIKKSWIDTMTDLSDYLSPIPTADDVSDALTILMASSDEDDGDIDFVNQNDDLADDDFGDDDMPF